MKIYVWHHLDHNVRATEREDGQFSLRWESGEDRHTRYMATVSDDAVARLEFVRLVHEARAELSRGEAG